MAQAATASADSETKRRPLTNFVLASYGAPAAPLALSGLPIAVYLPVIYADSDGFALSLGIVGLLIGLSRISDVVTDPLIGYLSDRWKTRWGRRKPWVLIGTPIFAAGMWLLFMPPFEFSDVTVFGATFSNGYIWLFAMLTLFYIGSTVKDLPFSAWGAELSNEYHERTLIMSWKEGLGVFGSLVSSFIPLFILFFGEVKPTDAVFWLVLVMCISMPIVNLNCLIVVPEWRVVEQPRRIGVFEGLKIVVKNKPYMILVIVFALGAVGSAMTKQPVAVLRQARDAGRRDLRRLPGTVFRLSGRRHSAVVQAVASHRQAQDNHVGDRLVFVVVVVHPAGDDRAPPTGSRSSSFRSTLDSSPPNSKSPPRPT